MSRTTLIISILVLGAAAASARTFEPAPYLAEARVEVLNRTVANDMVGRDLFGGPYATAVIGHVDVYDRFPYVESRFFQIVSDPSWDRLLMGELGGKLSSYDGSTGGFGALVSPRGLSSDAMGRVYVADTGNDRVLVFSAVSEYDRIELEPLYSIDGLSRPYDVAVSDAGTPFDDSDDILYVANTGRNEVRRYELADGEARMTHAIGGLGSAAGSFAGPMAITVGRTDGVHSQDVYVSDAHNGRLVRLRDSGSALEWAGAIPHDLRLITSLDTDHWGNVYAAAPQTGVIAKFTGSLIPLDRFSGGTERPRSFHVPFANVTDHRTGEQRRSGQGNGVVVEQWNSDSGLRLLNLGVELSEVQATDDGETTSVRMTLTDHAIVTAEITDPHSGRVIARHEAGVLNAGYQTIRFSADDYLAEYEEGEYRVTLRAHSTYKDNTGSEIEVPVVMSSAGGPASPNKLALLGNTPNPFNPTTTIRFTVPAGPVQAYSLRVYDVRGRLVRELAAGQISGGLHQVLWDGRNNTGSTVGSGIYLYRLEVGQERFTGKMALVK